MQTLKQKLLCLLLTSPLLLTGCAVMSVEECQVADWEALGYQHGSKGIPPQSNELAPYIKACAKANISPDQQAYEIGRAEGAREYCHPENGFELGRSGKTYNYVCDPDLEDAFLDQYDLGHELFNYEEAIRIVERDISQLEKERDEIQDDLADNRELINLPDTLDRERKELRGDNYRLKQEVENIENELDRLAYRLIQKERDLENYERSMGYR